MDTTTQQFIILITCIPILLLILLLTYIFRNRIIHSIKDRSSSERMIIPFTDIQPLNNQIWVWPELLNGTSVSLNQLEVGSVKGPRFIPSAAFYATINSTSKSCIVKMYTLKVNELLIESRVKKVDLEKVGDEEQQLGNLKSSFIRSKDTFHYKNMMRIKHDSIAQLIHLSINDLMLLACYEDMGKGNLEDVLLSRRFPLNLFIKHGLFYDLLNGLTYLHAQTGLYFHGDLNPRNCLVDDNWILKIAGFGHYDYVERDYSKSIATLYDSRFFIAPEMITYDRSNISMKIEELQMADVYSLGMLVSSIFTEKFPFEGESIEHTDDILLRIQTDSNSSVRPILPENMRFEIKSVISLSTQKFIIWKAIRNSWRTIPQERVYAADILNDINKIKPFATKYKRRFKRLEYAALCCSLYATELEEFIEKVESAYTNQTIQNLSTSLTKVEKEHLLFSETEVLGTKLKELEVDRDHERIVQSKEIVQIKVSTQNEIERLEKQLIELKYSQLPKPFMKVMHDTSSKRVLMDKVLMRAGANIVDLERNIRQYPMTTILVVSIRSFEKLVARLELHSHLLLELMNRFYFALEEIAESVGGVYLVDKSAEKCVFVSGAPIANKIHCESITHAALLFKKWAENWDVSWILGGDEEKLELNIGIHSGPILGGIIGTIPKFLLIGPTHDIALGIHNSCNGGNEIRMSAVSQLLLAGKRDFLFESTGQIDLGDKGGLVWTFTVESSAVDD